MTIAFAVDFKTPGEILTHKVAYGKYHAVELKGWPYCIEYSSEVIVKMMYTKKRTKLNIAGNGIYSLQQIGDQKTIDKMILDFLSIIKLKFDNKFSIRSGGQTGVDEAALKAGDKLGLETICLAPKNWLFRDINGKDISDEEKFLARFGTQYINDI